MTEGPAKRRKSTRLRHHDYSAPGYYFFTVVTQGRTHLFGRIDGETMLRSAPGEVVASVWLRLPLHYLHVALDEFVVMPNHVHGIVVLLDEADIRADQANTSGSPIGAGSKTAPTKHARRHGLPEVVRAFKTYSARAVNEARETPGAPVWQRSYYERVIRDEAELERAREYICLNPLKWHLDEENR